MVDIAVIGARGYLGRELMRLLLAHPRLGALTPVTGGEPGKLYGDTVPGFRHRKDLVLRNADDKRVRDADVVFLATDGEEARTHAAALTDTKLIIDLSRAHRHAAFESGSSWTYGLSEFAPGVPKGSRRIANPGCYPTASLFASLPAIQAGLAAPGVLISDGKSGVSGAGATPRGDLHFPEANEAVRAYKVLGHDHLAEIRLAVHRAEGIGSSRPVRFTPHLVPMNRGLLATAYLPLKAGITNLEVQTAYAKAYANSAFVRMVPEPDTSHVRGSNFADVAVDVDVDSNLLVARCAIDNLVKGGSGTAVQNMNLALGFAVAEGLPLSGGGP